VVTAAIHRLVEQQAASRADAIAILDSGRTVTYRELNTRANTIARQLVTAGLRRGSHAVVRMDVSADLVILLLAVLKAGASYAYIDAAGAIAWPVGVSMQAGGQSGHEGDDAQHHDASETCRYVSVDVSRGLRAPVQASPNLPVLTRGSDTACVLRRDDADVLIPHAAIAALAEGDHGRAHAWSGDPGAFEPWVALIAGATLTIGEDAAVAAA
jgi:hypothetical protein